MGSGWFAAVTSNGNRGILAKGIGDALTGVLLSTWAAFAARAQPTGEIAGRVTSALSGEALAGGYVTVEGTRLRVVTDADGGYTIPAVPPGIQLLRTSAIGYAASSESLRVEPGRAARLDLRLRVRALPPDAVLVTARGRESRLRELAGSAGVVGQEDIAQRNPLSVAASLAYESVLSWSAQTRATYGFGPHWSAHLAAARSFRSPGLEERYLYVDLGHIVRLGDPARDSEDGLFLEAGLQARTNRVQWTCQAFRNRVRNLVIDVPAVFEGRTALRKTNAGEAQFIGFEAELDTVVAPSVLASADVAYVRGTDLVTDEALPAAAPLNGRLSVRYHASCRPRVEAALNLTAEQLRVGPGEEQTDGYATVDTRLGHEGRRHGGSRNRLTVGLKNAFSRQYRDHLATSRGFAMDAPGRSLSLSWSGEL
jgi:hypothetical protein